MYDQVSYCGNLPNICNEYKYTIFIIKTNKSPELLRDLLCFSQLISLSTEKNHLTVKFNDPSITFATNIICTYLRYQ